MENVIFDGAYLVHAKLSSKQILESKFCENLVLDAMKFIDLCKNWLIQLIYLSWELNFLKESI